MSKTPENGEEIYAAFPTPCVLCGGIMQSVYDSHNAEPVSRGRCCAACNTTVIIPARLKLTLDKLG